MICTIPSGAPARSAASAMSRAASLETWRAAGWGLMTMALRVMSASSTLNETVHTGFVDGTRAKITPAGLGTSTILRAGSRRQLTKSWSR